MRINVLILSAHYPPDPDGVATHVETLAHCLTKKKDAIDKILVLTSCDVKNHSQGSWTHGGKLLVEKFERQSVANYDHQHIPLHDIVERSLEVFKKYNNFAPDIIHSHDYQSLYLGFLFKHRFNCPLILTVHRASADRPDESQKEESKDFFLNVMLKNNIVDHVIVPSSASEKALNASYRDIPIKVIAHGLKLDRYQQQPDMENILDELGILPDMTLIICPVRDDPHKNLGCFIGALNAIASEMPERKFYFLATADMPRDDGKAFKLGSGLYYDPTGLPSNARFFARPFAWTEMATLFRRAAGLHRKDFGKAKLPQGLCIVPSISESFGLVVLEAFAYKCPVVVSNSGALPEIVQDGVNGRAYTVNDHAHLAMIAISLLRDQAQCGRISRKALSQWDARWSAENMIKEYVDFYQDCIRIKK